MPKGGKYNNMMTAGKLLKYKREELGKSIDEVAAETKIQKRYLEMIEKDKYEKFDSEIFLSGFLKIYAGYVGISSERVLALYRRTRKNIDKKKEVKLEKPVEERNRFSPKLIIGAILTVLVLAVVFYFSFQLYNFQSVPDLVITSPENNIEVTEPEIKVSGVTDRNTLLTINDTNIPIDEQGAFSHTITLVPGTNSIAVRSTRRGNETRETVRLITIKYTPPVEEVEEQKEESEEPEEKAANIFRLAIEGEAAWVQLIVDGSQELGHIVAPGYDEQFEAKENFELTTGRAANTKLYINNETDPYNFGDQSGVVTISCELDNNRFICDN